MNEKDIKEGLSEYFELLDPASHYLISLSPYFVNHASTSLLDHLINSRARSCLYICIGRPHIFIERILSNKDINLRKVTFMDMALYIGRQVDRVEGQHRIIVGDDDENLAVPAIFKLYRFDQELRKVDLREFDIVVIDNISELAIYNTREQLEDFIHLFYRSVIDHGKGLFIYRFNTGKDDGLVEISTGMGMEHVEIPDLVVRDRS